MLSAVDWVVNHTHFQLYAHSEKLCVLLLTAGVRDAVDTCDQDQRNTLIRNTLYQIMLVVMTGQPCMQAERTEGDVYNMNVAVKVQLHALYITHTYRFNWFLTHMHKWLIARVSGQCHGESAEVPTQRIYTHWPLH